jgi:acyl-CoA hydrolase
MRLLPKPDAHSICELRSSYPALLHILVDHFKHRENINCYIGSNAATPTANIDALTEAIKEESAKLPFMKMFHLLLHGNIPYLEEGLQDRVKAYSIFSGEAVRKAANEGRAYYLPCTLGTMDRLIGKGFGL